MNTKRHTSVASNAMTARFGRRIGRAPAASLVLLALALPGPGRAATLPAAIPFSDIAARATAGYQGDALGVTATAEGACLRCGFQKLEGQATPEGLWLESTAAGGGRLRLVATVVGRDSSRARECALTEPDVLTLFAPTDVGGYTALATSGKVSVNGKLVRFTRPGLTEEYSVSVDGVRQDFIIESPPFNPPPLAVLRRAGQPSTLNQSADLRLELALSGARAEATASGARLTFLDSGRTLAYGRLRAEDATGRELTADLAVLAPDRLAVTVADGNATYPVRIDPTFSDADWVCLGSGMNGTVYALAVSGTNLYAGGSFTTAGGLPANNIAKWDGSTWSALGSGVARMPGYSQGVYALAVDGTNLYVGGEFTTAGELPANNVAKWNGSAWSALGSGVLNIGGYQEIVVALAVEGTSLYAGGFFATAGGVSANGVAKWDGSAWSALGSGMMVSPDGRGNGGYVDVLAVSGTNLYAGGWFTNVSGVSANYVAKWDGSAWSALGSGVNDEAVTLALDGTNLYLGGVFSIAGGVSANCIAKWNGRTWSGLSSGTGAGNYPTCVYALAVSGTDLYAGGNFTTAGGVLANNVAKWDGYTWSALGAGMSGGNPDSYVYALAADGAGRLFVGGAFYLAGTNVSPYVAQAELGSAPSILMPPKTQTAEAGATTCLAVNATGEPPPSYQWYFNGTNLPSCASSNLVLTNILFSESGTYTVVVTNRFGAMTSAPVAVNVVPAVQRRPVPGVQVTGQPGSLWNVVCADPLSPAPNWTVLGSVGLLGTPQYYFDLTQPLPPQRFYRAQGTADPFVLPVLDLRMIPAITLTGSIGSSVRVDAINRIGPVDAWITLNTVTLTNTSQLYFDTSAVGQPQRLYRLVQVP